jgi:hypothetical protein
MRYLVRHATWINGILYQRGAFVSLTSPQARRYVSSGMIVPDPPSAAPVPDPEPALAPEPVDSPPSTALDAEATISPPAQEQPRRKRKRKKNREDSE